jgi:tRNA (adenine57-N1/adenine58-N1)-methyltransferase
MAEGTVALKRRERATKDVHSDIDALTPEERAARLAELELRDISDRKLRKVLRDLDVQTALLHDATDHDDQALHDSSAHAVTSNDETPNDETSTDVTSTKAPSNDAEHHA